MNEAVEEEREKLSSETVTIQTETVREQHRTKYSWVVLFASFMTQFLSPSLNYAAGVFHVALLKRFHSDVTLTAWLGAVHTAFFALAAPIASLVANTLDCRSCVLASGILGLLGYGASAFVTDLRWLFLTYAVTAGLGQAFAQVASLVILGYYFPDDTAMASGIVFSGTALGIFVHPPLVQTFIDWYGLSGAFLLTGAVVFHCCILGLLMRPSQNELIKRTRIRSGRTPKETTIFALFGGFVKNKKLLGEFAVWTFMVSNFCHTMAIVIHIIFLPDYMERTHNVSPQESSMVISFIGIGNLASRLCLGALANDKQVGPEVIYFSILGITAVITLFLPVFAQGTGGRFSYGLLIGLYAGGVAPLQSAMAFQMGGVENFAFVYGVTMFFKGLAFLLGPPTGGGILQVTGDYNNVFKCSSAILFASSLSGFLSALRRKYGEWANKQKTSL